MGMRRSITMNIIESQEADEDGSIDNDGADLDGEYESGL